MSNIFPLKREWTQDTNNIDITFYITKDNKLCINSSIQENLSNIHSSYSNYTARSFVFNDGTVKCFNYSISNEYIPGTTQLIDKNIVQLSGRSDFKNYTVFTGLSKNLDIYCIANSKYYKYLPEYDTPDILQKITSFPEDDKPCKVITNAQIIKVISMKGNVYLYGGFINNIGFHIWTKLNLSNIVQLSSLDWTERNMYALDENGDVWYTYNPRYTQYPISEKIESLHNIKRIIEYHEGTYLLAQDINNKIYILHKANIIWEATDYKELIAWNSKIIDIDGGLYNFTITEDENEITINIDAEPYDTLVKGDEYDLRLVHPVIEFPPYIILDIDHYMYEYNSTKYTNLKYKYRFKLNQNISADGTRNVVNYVALFCKNTLSSCI